MALSREKGKLVARLLNPRQRSRASAFVVEGVRGAREALAGSRPAAIRLALVAPGLQGTEGGRRLFEKMRDAGISMEEISDRELADLSDTEHSQGVLLVVEEPGEGLEVLEGEAAPRILVLDGIQDPGNAGTLIRSAHAFGLHGVLVLDGSVDPFNPKVVRASAGAWAHLPVLRVGWADASAWLRRRELPVLVADPGGDDIRDVPTPPAWALVVGNEGAGPRPEVMEGATRVVGIPVERGVGSLNAGLAGAILLFALSSFPREDGGGEGNQREN